jgi:hypothetical protein
VLPKFNNNAGCQRLISVSDSDTPQRFIVAKQFHAALLFQLDSNESSHILSEASKESNIDISLYLGLALIVSPDLGFTIASSLLILPGTLEEKLKIVTGWPLVIGILMSKTTSCTLNSFT